MLHLAEWFDQIGSHRLRAVMDIELPRVRQAGHLLVSAAGQRRMLQAFAAHLQHISPSTMDRLRAKHRCTAKRLRGGTKPGSLLKHQIAVRTFADWDDKRIGFVEIDLVQHDGGNASGIFACTLSLHPELAP